MKGPMQTNASSGYTMLIVQTKRIELLTIFLTNLKIKWFFHTTISL